MPLLACTACIDLQFKYNYPYLGYALVISFVWFWFTAFRSTSETSKGHRELWFWVLVIGSIWFTLCMVPLTWGGFTGVVTGIVALKALLSSQTPKPRRKLAGLALAGMVILSGSSAWTYSRLEHHIAWLGRLPTHSAINRRPADIIRSAGSRGEPLLVREAELELSNTSNPNWIRLGALSREIALLNRPELSGVMTKLRDLAVQTSQTSNGFLGSSGLSTTILACGEASSCNLTHDFAKQAENKLQAKSDFEALIFATALGLTDRDAAIQWREAHPVIEPEGGWGQSKRQRDALDRLWDELKKGPVAPELIQKQLDAFPPVLID